MSSENRAVPESHNPGGWSVAAYGSLVVSFLGGVLLYHQLLANSVFQAADWPKEMAYLYLLKEALEELRLPLYLSRPIQNTSLFLANPEINLSPQVLLLRFTSIEAFVHLNVLLLYSIGFAGWVKAAKKFSVPPLYAALASLTFLGNGYFLSRIAVGHFMWVSCFLFPWWALAISDLIECPSRKAIIKVGFWSWLILLQGGFHQFIWLNLFALLLALATGGRLLVPLLKVIGLNALLGAFRIVPAAYAYAGHKHPFLTGFHDFTTLWLGLVGDYHVGITTRPWAPHIAKVGWWEFDHYLGIPGLIVLAVCCWVWMKAKTDGSLALACGLLTLLSLGQIMEWMSKLSLPFVDAERVPSRFFIVVLLFCLIMGLKHLGQAMRDPKLLALGAGLLVWQWWALWTHLEGWRPEIVERFMMSSTPYLVHFTEADFPLYQTVVAASWGVTLLSLAGAAWSYKSGGAK